MWFCWVDLEELDDDVCQSLSLISKSVATECHPITKWGACCNPNDTGLGKVERPMCVFKAFFCGQGYEEICSSGVVGILLPQAILPSATILLMQRHPEKQYGIVAWSMSNGSEQKVDPA